jgi:hypothetical protein
MFYWRIGGQLRLVHRTCYIAWKIERSSVLGENAVPFMSSEPAIAVQGCTNAVEGRMPENGEPYRDVQMPWRAGCLRTAWLVVC